MEPDDRIALSILAELVVPAERVLFIGTSLLNSRRKAKLARHQLKSTALCSVPVYAGIYYTSITVLPIIEPPPLIISFFILNFQGPENRHHNIHK